MPIRQLPNNPSLENLRKQAKSLQKSVLAKESNPLTQLQEFHPRPVKAVEDFRLSDAQLVIARSYDFVNWSSLKKYVETVARHSFLPAHPNSAKASDSITDRFVRLACLDYLADHVERRKEAHQILAQDPAIASSSIYSAATVGDVAIVHQMLQQNPKLATLRGGPHNWEPLLYAAYSRLNSDAPEHSTLRVARLLLDFGADPNAGFLWDCHYVFTALTGVFGEGEAGPLHQPEHQYCYHFARLLLEAGADPNDSQTLYNRMFTGGSRHLQLLFQFGLGKGGDGVWFKRLGARLDSPAEMLQQQMGWAAKYNQIERMKLLIANGVDLNAADKRLKRTPYELAVLHGNKEMAQLLLENGAHAASLSEADAFAAACLSADASRARSLLSENPTLIVQLGSRRVELLQLAAESDKKDAVRLMNAVGFNLNEVCRTTALHNAAMSGHLEMVKLLIQLGANPLIKDWEFNATPRGWAEYSGKTEVADYLKSVES